MNPPYQEKERACARNCKKKRCGERGHCVTADIPGTADWMSRLVADGNGIALIFARTETGIFFPHVWHRADAFFAFDTRLTFYTVDGSIAPSNGGAPSWLIAYGRENVEAIRELEKGIELQTPKGSVIAGGKFIALTHGACPTDLKANRTRTAERQHGLFAEATR